MWFLFPAPQIDVAQPGHSSQSDTDNVQIILDAVEVNGKDWDLVSHATNIPSQECQLIFDNLAKAAIKQDADFVKEIKRTGTSITPISYIITCKSLVLPRG